MRGHVTAASIKTNLYCKETPLGLFVCHEPRLFPWNLCWPQGRSLHSRAPPGQMGAGWEGPLMGPHRKYWVRIPSILSWLPNVCLGAVLAPRSRCRLPRLPDQARGLVCAGPAALGHWGDRAGRPPTAWLPQKQHGEQRLLSLPLPRSHRPTRIRDASNSCWDWGCSARPVRRWHPGWPVTPANTSLPELQHLSRWVYLFKACF